MKKFLATLLSAIILVTGVAFIAACGESEIGLKNYLLAQSGKVVEGEFVLDSKVNDVEVEWTSSNPDVIAIEKREEDYLAKVHLGDTAQTVTLTISHGKEKKDFSVDVRAYNTSYIIEKFSFPKSDALVYEDFDLPVSYAPAGYEGKAATIAWSVADEYKDYISVNADGNKCVVPAPAENKEVAITAAFTYGGKTLSENYSFTVAVDNRVTLEPLDPADPTGVYKVYMTQVQTNQTLYLTGEMSGYYYATEEDVTKAADVEVAKSGDGYTLKVTTAGVAATGKYLEVKPSGTFRNAVFSDTSTGVWKYNADLGTFVWTLENDGDYWLGTSGTYRTFGANNVSKITGDNASKVGVSEYIATFGKIVGASVTPPPQSETPDAKIDFAAIEKGTEINAEAAFELLKGCGGTDAGLTAVEVSKVWQAGANGFYKDKGGYLKLGAGSANGELTLTFDKKVTKVVVNAIGWTPYVDENTVLDTVAVNDSDAQSMVGVPKNVDDAGEVKDYEFTLDTASNTVKIITGKRALIFSISVYFED